jgi:Virulence factor
MAKYQVMFWKHIPAQVKAWDEGGEVKRMLPDRFQAAIDAYAMKDGSTEMDAYLEAWRWGDTQDRPGSAEEVASAVVRELDVANPRSKLMQHPLPDAPHEGEGAAKEKG